MRNIVKRLDAFFFVAVLIAGGFSSLHSIMSAYGENSIRNIVAEMRPELPYQETLINLNGAWENVLGKRIVRDAEPQYDVYRMENGQLTFLSTAYDQSYNAYQLHLLERLSDEQGADFLYVQTPHKINKYDNEMPEYVVDSCNENADHLLSLCKDIDTLDLRDLIYVDGLEHSEMFFGTDHHWTPECALWASRQVISCCNRRYQYGLDLSPLEKDKYIFDNYERTYLGSQGKRVGLLYAGCDDFTAVYPKDQHTQYQVALPLSGQVYTGAYSEVLFDLDYASSRDYFNSNNYQAYLKLGDGSGFQELQNLSNPTGRKMLLFRDSFASSVVTFLLPYFSEIDMVDLRYCQEINIREYIHEKKPDIVMVMYNPDLLGWGVPFAFGLD